MVEVNFEDLMAGARAVAKVPGASPDLGGLEPLTGTFGERIIQALNIINQIFSQWTKLSQDPTFRDHILSRLPGAAEGDLAAFKVGQGGPPPIGLSEQQMAGVVRGMMAGALTGFINRMGDKTLDQVIQDFGPVKLSQLLKMLSGAR